MATKKGRQLDFSNAPQNDLSTGSTDPVPEP